MRDNEKETCMIRNVVVSGHRNVISKILKYKNRYNINAVIPVIRQATGTISKSFRKYLSNIPGKHEIKELQKTAILGTAHTLWKVLM